MATEMITTTVTATITSMDHGIGPEVIRTMPCYDWAVAILPCPPRAMRADERSIIFVKRTMGIS